MADIYSILAGKGRGEDEYIRKVFGEPSHVNEVEKDAIDIYGLLGEIFTKNVGSGDTNPNTGLPEYDFVKTAIGTKVKGNPHNKRHWGEKETWPGWHEGLSREESRIQAQQEQMTVAGETLLSDTSGQTIGEMGLGQEAYTAEEYQGMTPQQIVDDIFAKQYNNQVPPGKGTKAEFKAEIAGTLQNMPQFKGVDPKALGFEEEAKDIAIEQTNIAAQKDAQQVGGAKRSVYGGSGVGTRAAIGAGTGLAKTYGLGLETADLGYRQGVYGLEQQAGADWEQDYTGFLGTLPSAV